MRKTLVVVIYSDRKHVGKLSIVDSDNNEVRSFEVAAMAHDDLEFAAHPEVGNYKLLKTVDVPGNHADAAEAYGSKIMYFIKAGSHLPEDVIIIHGGALGDDGRLVATEGGLRLSKRTSTRCLTWSPQKA